MTDRSASPLQDSFPELGRGVGGVVRALRDGLPAACANTLASALGVPAARIAELLGASASTLARRRWAGRLGLSESERAYRIGWLVGRAADGFGKAGVGVAIEALEDYRRSSAFDADAL